MKSYVNVKAALLISLLCIAGCAHSPGTGGQQSAERNTAVGTDCVFLQNLYNWQALNDRSLVVWTLGGEDAYLVTIAPDMLNLSFAEDLRFEDGDGNGMLCGFGGDAITMGGLMAQRSTVQSVRKLSAAQLADLLASSSESKGKKHEVGESP